MIADEFRGLHSFRASVEAGPKSSLLFFITAYLSVQS